MTCHDERARNLRDDALRWCSVCEKWFSPIIAKEHDHFPANSNPRRQYLYEEVDLIHMAAPEIRGLSRSWRIKRSYRRIKWLTKQSITRLFTVTVTLFLAATLLLGGYHWYQDTPLEDSFRMIIDDYRVFASCPGNLNQLIDFIKRPQSIHMQEQLKNAFGSNWITAVCEQNALDSLN